MIAWPWLTAPAAAESFRLPTASALATAQTVFAERGRVTLEEVVSRTGTASIVNALAKRSLHLRAPSPRELSAGTPSYMFYEERLRLHRDCHKRCAPICRIADALTRGALLELARAIVGKPGLQPIETNLRVYVKGSHVDQETATRPGVEVMFCLSDWNPAFGGQFRFRGEETQTLPFAAMHLRDVRRGDSRAVTLITDHQPLVILSALLNE